VLSKQPWDVIGVVAAGGSFGAAVRYAMVVAWPTPAGSFPWTIFVVNTLGCALIGVLMAVIDVWPVHRLLRPMLGTGVLGGYTTFSTYAVDIHELVAADAAHIGLIYMAATPAAALAAVWAAVVATRVAMKGLHDETHR
jgi:CrcB protein